MSIDPKCVLHFDHKGKKYSKLKQVMRTVEKFGMEKNVWIVKSMKKVATNIS